MQDFSSKIEFMNNQEESKKLLEECFVSSSSKDDIHIVAEDYEELLEKGKYAEIFVSEAEGEKACLKVMQEIIDSISSIDAMAGVVFRFNIHPDVQVMELVNALNLFELYKKKPTFIWSTLTDNSLKLDYVKLSTVVVYKTPIKQ